MSDLPRSTEKAIHERLNGRSKAELVQLIEQMLRRDPELEDLIDLPRPKKGKQPKLEALDFERRADAIYGRSGMEWGASKQVGAELEALTRTGKDFLEAGNAEAAAAVYEGVCRSVLEHDGQLHDEPGYLGRVVFECSKGLGQCLQAKALPQNRREAILEVLFDVWMLDANQGGTGMGDTAGELLREQTTAAERQLVAEWVREGARNARDWTKGCCGSMLLHLTGKGFGDEEYLTLCREYGLRGRLLERLLELGRAEEAEGEAAAASDYDLLHLADLMVTHRQGKRAEQLVEKRSRSSNDRRLVEWLFERARVRKDRPAALQLRVRLFQAAPSLGGYRELRQLAGSPAEWQALAKSLLEPLRKEGYSQVLVEILLEEGDLAGALEAVKNERRAYWLDEPMRLKVAAACEKDRPRDALTIYRDEAQVSINRQGREHYEVAVKHLKKVRQLYERLGERPTWDRLIADIREKNRRLRALQEELSRAKL